MIIAGFMGYCVLGVVHGLIGVFSIRAALTYDPDKIGGWKEALNTLASQPYGPWILAVSQSVKRHIIRKLPMQIRFYTFFPDVNYRFFSMASFRQAGYSALQQLIMDIDCAEGNRPGRNLQSGKKKGVNYAQGNERQRQR